MARNPSAIPADTPPEVWRIQMAAIARRGVAERIAEWEALNRQVAAMEADDIRRRHPGYSEREVFLAIVQRRYGADVASEAWPEVAVLLGQDAAP